MSNKSKSKFSVMARSIGGAVAARCFNGYMTIQNCDVRGAGSGSMCFGCEANGLMFLLDNNRTRNNANYGMRVSAGGRLWVQGALTLQNTPNYGTAFASVETGGLLDNHGGGDTVYGTGDRQALLGHRERHDHGARRRCRLAARQRGRVRGWLRPLLPLIP